MARRLKEAEFQRIEEPDEDYIATVFAPGGVLARQFAGYQVRQGQVELACAVDQKFQAEKGGTVLAEAPTGTGKSIAYSVPASWQAARKNRRTVLVTANIALQEQLAVKDLPFLRSALPWPFTFALIKGINNYLCFDRFAESENDLLLSRGAGLEPEALKQWEHIREWARLTQTGDVSELPFEALPATRRLFTTSTDDCIGRACPEHDRCHSVKARRAARSADLVVTNYHLFFADLAIKVGSDGMAGVLPAYDQVVLDEAHEAANIARDFFGFRVTRGSISWATRLLGGAKGRGRKSALPAVNEEMKAQVGRAADRFFSRLFAYSKSDDYNSRLHTAGAVDGSELGALMYEAAAALTHASESGSLSADRREELRKASDRCSALANQLEATTELRDDGEVVYFLEPAGRDRVALRMKPIEVADLLKANLFERVEHGTILTSATLSTGGRSGFDHIATEVGAVEADELEVDSPFDFEENALLIVPDHLPMPQKPEFAGMVAETLVDVVTRMRGRTLGLFTSYRVLDIAHKRFVDQALPYRVMRQGEAPRTQLVQRFKEDEESVLLGTASFWQGIDVPGASLSCVFIDRLPFETPEDPILSAISDRDRGWFKNYSLPRAVIAFKQGVGRLIRTTSDRGVIVCCDRRLLDKPYGRKFIRSLPEMRVTRDLEEIRDFIT